MDDLDTYLQAHPINGWYASGTERTDWVRTGDDGVERRLYIGQFFAYERNGTGMLELTMQFWSAHPRLAMQHMQKSGRCPMEFDGQEIL